MNTKPKHKRVLRDGQTPRGPARWFRAADNAMRRPMTDAGQLFWKRAKIAQEFAEASSVDGPWEHLQRECVTVYPDPRRYEMKRQYVTCGRFCMAMVAQLDFTGIRNLSSFVNVVSDGSAWQKVRHLPDGPTRTSRCQFCSGPVKS